MGKKRINRKLYKKFFGYFSAELIHFYNFFIKFCSFLKLHNIYAYDFWFLFRLFFVFLMKRKNRIRTTLAKIYEKGYIHGCI